MLLFVTFLVNTTFMHATSVTRCHELFERQIAF